MQISEEILKFWADNLDKKDKSELAKQLGVSKATVSIAFNQKQATEKNITAITQYFKDKVARVESQIENIKTTSA